MGLNRFVIVCVVLCAAAAAPAARGAEHCWIEHAVRAGNGVKVYLFHPKGNPPGVDVPMTLVHADGSGVSINQPVYTSVQPVKITTRNPRTNVVLYVGDKLEFAGMDYGCSVTLMRVGSERKSRLKAGCRLPRARHGSTITI